MADRETVQRGGAGVGGVGDATRAWRLESGGGAGSWPVEGEGERADSGVWRRICCVELLQAEDRASAGAHVGVEGDAGLSSRRIAARLGLRVESATGSGSV